MTGCSTIVSTGQVLFMRLIRRPKPNHAIHAPSAQGFERSGSAVTVGNFDGVHRGHQTLLEQVHQAAHDENLVPTVITLQPHPREFFDPNFKLRRISTLRDQVAAMQQCGIEQMVLLPFEQSLANLNPITFVEQILVKQLNARHVWVGDDFRFGANRNGDFTLLEQLAPQHGFAVHHIAEIHDQGQRVSSSSIRSALARGDIERATELLGRPITYSGHVLHGKKLGRKLGFPTMNLAFKGRASALNGILAVWVHGVQDHPLAAVASLGVRPTVEQSEQILFEVFVPNWEGNTYGRVITAEVVHFIRPEQHFDNIEAMVQQMHRDTELALEALRTRPSQIPTPSICIN